MKLTTSNVATAIITLAVSVAFLTAHAQSQSTYTAPQNDAVQDFHIDRDGNIIVRQAKIMQVSGTSFYARYYVGLAFIRILIKTDKTTAVQRRFGDRILISQIEAGDIVNLEGKIENGADSLSIVASKLVNFSNQKEISSFKGTIIGRGSKEGSFTLMTENQSAIQISTGTTTQIRKGSRIITPDLVRNGDRVTDTVGTFDHTSKNLDANVVVIYADMNVYQPRNFEGTLKTVTPGTPTTLILNTEGKDYTVILQNNAEILNKARKSVSIKRYLEGDTVRVYGAVREAEEPIIDVEVVRNVSLQ
ncbi:MAG: hypothetical protein Q7S86_00980 [bacterium]|nr:hypothetical protein [bacterium]